MEDPSNSSFIPKRGPVKRRRAKRSRQVYVFTIMSYVLLFATLLATAGIFFGERYVLTERDDEIAALNEEISSFKESDMQRVLDFDFRLQQANGRLQNSVSIVSILQALESATIDTVKIEELSLERMEDTSYSLTAAIQTDSFDSTIFQRDVYNDPEAIFSSVDVNSVETSAVSSEDEAANPVLRPLVTFTAELEIPLEAIPYVPNPDSITSQPEVNPTVITDPETEEALLNSADENEPVQEGEGVNQDGV